MFIGASVRRGGWILFALACLGAGALHAADPFIAGIAVQPPNASDGVRLQARWVELNELSAPWIGGGWSIHSIEKATALLEHLRAERRSDSGNVVTLRAGVDRPAVLAFSPRSADPEAPATRVMITVGGVPQEFTARNVGVEVELYPESGDGTESSGRLRAVVKRTRFLGFRELAPDGAESTRRSGFYRPIFETETSESVLSMGAGKCAILRVDWPPPSAREWVDRALEVSAAKDAWRPAKAGPALLVVTPNVNAFPGPHDL